MWLAVAWASVLSFPFSPLYLLRFSICDDASMPAGEALCEYKSLLAPKMSQSLTFYDTILLHSSGATLAFFSGSLITSSKDCMIPHRMWQDLSHVFHSILLVPQLLESTQHLSLTLAVSLPLDLTTDHISLVYKENSEHFYGRSTQSTSCSCVLGFFFPRMNFINVRAALHFAFLFFLDKLDLVNSHFPQHVCSVFVGTTSVTMGLS